MEVRLGKYRHFKGGVYEIVGVAKHSETLEELVLYKNKRGEFWARPKKMFFESVFINGEEMPRFKYIGK